MNTKARSYMVLMGVLLVVLAASTQVLAQSAPIATPTAEFEIIGTVNAIDAATITVSGQVIQTSGAEFKDTVTLGELVKVHVSVAADGTLVAREVELAPVIGQNLVENEMEIVGVVEAITADSITIGGQVISIINAEIKDPIEVGALVKIHLSVAADNTLVAREVELTTEQTVPVADDAAGHDLNDDHGNDGLMHDVNDDHGSQLSGDSGRGSGESGEDSGGHGGDGGDDHGGQSGHG